MKRFLLIIILIQLGTWIICLAQKHNSSHVTRTSSSHSSVSHNVSRSPSHSNSVNHSSSNSNSHPASHNNNHSSTQNSHNSYSGGNIHHNNYHSSGSNNGRNFSGGNNNISQQPGRMIQTSKLGRPLYPRFATATSATHNSRITAPRIPSLAGYRAPVSVYYPGDMYYPYGGYYGYNQYFYNPYFYNPFYDMWNLGLHFMFTPHYCLGTPVMGGYNSYNNNNDQDVYDNSLEVSNGYVVFENDTISGNMTIKKHAIKLYTADTAQEYDYVFRNHQKGLKSVVATNEDQKELDLVRLGDNHKKLYRLIHFGKLNIYDEGRNYIYRPEDIEANSITVVYNNEVISLASQNRDQVKLRLASFINKVYGSDINPNYMDWNSLLIYIDKLD